MQSRESKELKPRLISDHETFETFSLISYYAELTQLWFVPCHELIHSHQTMSLVLLLIPRVHTALTRYSLSCSLLSGLYSSTVA